MLGWSISFKNKTKNDAILASWETTKCPHDWVKSIIERGGSDYESGQGDYHQVHNVPAKEVTKELFKISHNLEPLKLHKLSFFSLRAIMESKDDDIITIETYDLS